MQIDPDPSVAQLSAVDHRMLHEVVAERLRELIIDGSLQPAARLNERVLCARLGVSRTPLREALRTLAGEGMIELLPNRGAVVAQLSRVDVEHAFELMAALEALSGQLAAQRATVAEIDEVRALHFEMLAAHARRDLPAYYRSNRVIHHRISACARNPLLAASYQRLNCRLHALRFRSNLDPDKWDAAVREHGEIVDALAARDGQRLGGLLRDHLWNKRVVVLSQLDAAVAGQQGDRIVNGDGDAGRFGGAARARPSTGAASTAPVGAMQR
jgi:DNA-binding GntR family transcriptional regulator